MTAFPKYASGLSENSMRVSENPTATATLQNVTDETDNAQLRSKKTSPDLNYTAESKSLQINKERLIVQENPGSTNRLHRRVPRPRLCFRTTRFSPITPNQQDSPILQGGCSADPEATLCSCRKKWTARSNTHVTRLLQIRRPFFSTKPGSPPSQ